jgi:hypothetical protein
VAVNEKYTVEVEAEIKKFEANIEAARKNIESLEKTAQTTSKNVGKSFEDTKIKVEVQGVEQSTSSLEKFRSSLIAISKILLGAGGIIAGIKALQFVLQKLVIDGGDAGEAFRKVFTGAMSTAGPIGRLVSMIPGLNKNFAAIGRATQVVSINLSVLISALSSLGKNSQGFERFAKNYVSSITSLENGIKRFVSSPVRTFGTGLDLMGAKLSKLANETSSGVFANSLNILGRGLQNSGRFFTGFSQAAVSALTSAKNAIRNFVGGIPIVGQGILKFSDVVEKAFINITASTLGMIPGVGKWAKTWVRATESVAVTSAVLGAAGVNVGFLGAAVAGATVVLSAFNLVLAAVGGIMAKIGSTIIHITNEWAAVNAEVSLSLSRLEAVIDSLGPSMTQYVGSIDEWKKSITELGEATGASNTDIAQVALRFVELQPKLQLTREQLDDIIEVTTTIGVAFGDMKRSTVDVADAFNRMPGPLNQWLGIETDAHAKTEERVKVNQEMGESLKLLNSRTGSAAEAQLVYNIIMRRAGPIVDSIVSVTGNWIVANYKLNAALTNLKVKLGEAAQTINANFTTAVLKLVLIIKALPQELLTLVAGFVSLTGVILKVTGLFLAYSSILILVTNASKALTFALSYQFGFGKLGDLVALATRHLTGFNVAVKGTSSLIAVLGAFLLKGLVVFAKWGLIIVAAGVAAKIVMDALAQLYKVVQAGNSDMDLSEGIFTDMGTALSKLYQEIKQVIPSVEILTDKTRLLAGSFAFLQYYVMAVFAILGGGVVVLEGAIATFGRKMISTFRKITGSENEVLEGVDKTLSNVQVNAGRILTNLNIVLTKFYYEIGQAFNDARNSANALTGEGFFESLRRYALIVLGTITNIIDRFEKLRRVMDKIKELAGIAPAKQTSEEGKKFIEEMLENYQKQKNAIMETNDELSAGGKIQALRNKLEREYNQELQDAEKKAKEHSKDFFIDNKDKARVAAFRNDVIQSTSTLENRQIGVGLKEKFHELTVALRDENAELGKQIELQVQLGGVIDSNERNRLQASSEIETGIRKHALGIRDALNDAIKDQEKVGIPVGDKIKDLINTSLEGVSSSSELRESVEGVFKVIRNLAFGGSAEAKKAFDLLRTGILASIDDIEVRSKNIQITPQTTEILAAIEALTDMKKQMEGAQTIAVVLGRSLGESFNVSEEKLGDLESGIRSLTTMVVRLRQLKDAHPELPTADLETLTTLLDEANDELERMRGKFKLLEGEAKLTNVLNSFRDLNRETELNARISGRMSNVFKGHFDSIGDAFQRSESYLRSLIDQEQTAVVELEKLAGKDPFQDPDTAGRLKQYSDLLLDLPARIAATTQEFEKLKQIVELREIIQDVFSGITNAFHETIKGIILGTQTFAEGMNNMLQNILLSIGDTFFQSAMKKLSENLDNLLAQAFGLTNGFFGVLPALGGKKPEDVMAAASAIFAKAVATFAATVSITKAAPGSGNIPTGGGVLNFFDQASLDTADANDALDAEFGSLLLNEAGGSDVAGDSFNQLSEGFDEWFLDVDSTFTTFSDGFVEGFDITFDTISESFGSFSDVLVDGFTAMFEGIMEAGSSGGEEGGFGSIFKYIGAFLGGGGGAAGAVTAAKGGLIPGSGKTDSVALRATPGEFVSTPKSVDYYGADFFHAINQMAIPRRSLENAMAQLSNSQSIGSIVTRLFNSMPQFENGGIVGMPAMHHTYASTSGSSAHSTDDNRPIQVIIYDKSHKLDPAAFKMKPEEVTSIFVNGVKKDRIIRKVIREDLGKGN